MQDSSKTVIYVSSGQEGQEFEEKIRHTLLENSKGLPIVSVTQKPVNLGTNIVVGDVGASGFNFCRQVLIACEAAKTKFVISAESDCLYPPDYFQFTPERDDIPYRNTNIYVQRRGQDYVYKKQSSTFAQVIGREFYIKRLRELFLGQPEWDKTKKNFPKEIGQPLFKEFEYFESKYPCLSFKTGKGMRNWSNADTSKKHYKLLYWEEIKEVREYYE